MIEVDSAEVSAASITMILTENSLSSNGPQRKLDRHGSALRQRVLPLAVIYRDSDIISCLLVEVKQRIYWPNSVFMIDTISKHLE